MAKASRSVVITSTIAALLLLGSAPAKSSGVEMKPLEQTILEEDANAATNEHVMLRCMGLYSMFVQILPSQYKELGEKHRLLAQAFAAAAIESGANSDYTLTQGKIIIEAYNDRWQAAKAATGSGSDDPVIKSDAATCKRLAGG